MDKLENWLLNKVATKPDKFWAKIVLGLCFGLLCLVLFLKYKDGLSQISKLKVEKAIAEDDKKDAVLKTQLDNIKEKKGTLIKEVIKSDSKINTVDGNINKVKKETISDLKFVESLKDWDDVDKKIK